MFYDKFTSLCQAKGVSKSQAAKEIGFDRSSITKWKTKGFAPRQELLKKIAEYFSVSVNELLEIGKERPAISDEDIKFALFGTDDVTDEIYAQVCDFAKYVQNKYRKD